MLSSREDMPAPVPAETDRLLIEFVTKFKVLDAEETRMIVDNIRVEAYKKGTVLLQEGDFSGKCYFVLKGCVRQFCTVEGEEKTVAFLTEEQAVVSFSSYAQQIPSKHSYACLEDCVLIEGDPENEREMYQRLPKLEAIVRSMMEQDFGKTQEAFASFITSSPERRYLNLLETRPDLLQRVPQHQLASYLGVTPESLSRIRKRLLQKR